MHTRVGRGVVPTKAPCKQDYELVFFVLGGMQRASNQPRLQFSSAQIPPASLLIGTVTLFTIRASGTSCAKEWRDSQVMIQVITPDGFGSHCLVVILGFPWSPPRIFGHNFQSSFYQARFASEDCDFGGGSSHLPLWPQNWCCAVGSFNSSMNDLNFFKSPLQIMRL